ncbi:MAG: molybdate ABC transporter substrate-binding protein [Chloroflexi bacterium]|nr:molybdate ABC transporter substrate-binding protein [Chloroflexota bacterium]
MHTRLTGTPVRVTLSVYAAASLQDALVAIRTAYQATHPGTTLTISTDSSSAVEAQIEQGAPADLFLSADTVNPAKLVTAGLAAGAPVPFAGNALALIVPLANPAGIASPADLGRPRVKVIAAGDAVPITAYANRLLANLANLPGYPSGLAAAYAANVVSKEDNVKAVVAKVELGEGDAGIVYATDALASRTVVTIPLPEAATVRAGYAGVVVKSSTSAAAAALLAWLAGPEGQAVLARFGFGPPP